MVYLHQPTLLQLLVKKHPLTSEHAGENINLIFRALDDYMKDTPSWEEYWKGKKGW